MVLFAIIMTLMSIILSILFYILNYESLHEEMAKDDEKVKNEKEENDAIADPCMQIASPKLDYYKNMSKFIHREDWLY